VVVLSPGRPLIGIGMKMYRSHAQTLEWLSLVKDVVAPLPAVVSGDVGVFVLPGFVSLADCQRILGDTRVAWGAQDMYFEDAGAYTGEVSAQDLRDVGCSFVEVGHKERKTIFGESDDLVSRKTAQALRNGLVPIVCVGEAEQTTPREAAEVCLGQIEAYTSHARAEGLDGPLVLAYEPYWAIGSDKPAPVDYITEALSWMTESLDAFPGSVTLYGGSAGTGMVASLYPGVGGLFMGRSGHNVDTIVDVIAEATGARA
jgi:triosephosphate isomerase